MAELLYKSRPKHETTEEIYIPLAVIQSLKHIDLSVFTQYDVYDSLRIKITRAAQTLDIVQLDLQEANLLDIVERPSVFLLRLTAREQKAPAAWLCLLQGRRPYER